MAIQLASYLFASPQQWGIFFLPTLLVYLLLVHLLRHRRAKSLQRRFSPAGRASFGHMTTNDAQAILKDLTELEFPHFFGFAIILALFKAGNPDALLWTKRLPNKANICLLSSHRHTEYPASPPFSLLPDSLQMLKRHQNELQTPGSCC